MEADAQITFIYVADLERSTTFYRDRLGLELVLDQGGCRIFAVAGAAYLGICRRSDRPPAPGGTIVTLVVDDVDGWHERLSAAGVTFDHPPRRNDAYGIYHTFARDPDGYLVEIQRFDDADWAAPAERGRASSR